MTVADDRRRAVVGWYRISTVRSPGPTGSACAGSIRRLSTASRRGPSSGDAAESRNALVRGGDDLMGAGISVASNRRETAKRGDFQARLFVLEAVE